jgi:predicted HTH domain antitoxin
MKAQRFEILLPEEVVAGLGWADEEVSAQEREVLVIALLRRQAVSQRKAAELLHLNLRDLFKVMGRYKVPTLDLTPEELQRKLHTVFESRQQA